MDKGYNYEYLFLDFFLYYAKKSGFNTLQEAIGNTEEGMAFRNNQAGDSALDDNDFTYEEMNETYLSNVAQIMQSYLT